MASTSGNTISITKNGTYSFKSSGGTSSDSGGNTSHTIRFPADTVSPPAPGSGSGSGGCNESKVHDHKEKAVFHGMKSAFRMVSRGSKGVDNLQPEQAARIAAHAGIAFLRAADEEYDREDSFEYLRQNIVGDPRTIDRVLSLLGIEPSDLTDGGASRSDLEDGIEKAWTQIDSKSHHADGSRTAIAIAEAYLGERLWPGDDERGPG